MKEPLGMHHCELSGKKRQTYYVHGGIIHQPVLLHKSLMIFFLCTADQLFTHTITHADVENALFWTHHLNL